MYVCMCVCVYSGVFSVHKNGRDLWLTRKPKETLHGSFGFRLENHSKYLFGGNIYLYSLHIFIIKSFQKERRIGGGALVRFSQPCTLPTSLHRSAYYLGGYAHTPLKGHAHLSSYRRRESASGWGRRGGGGSHFRRGRGGSHLSSDRRMPRALRGLSVLRLFFLFLAPLGHTVVLDSQLSRPAECLVVSAYLGVYAGMLSNRQLCFAHRCLVLCMYVYVCIYTRTNTHIYVYNTFVF